jgi:hypothetical protein
VLKTLPTLTRRPSLRKAAVLATAAAIAAPAATAAADEQIVPPKADAYLQPVFLNNGNALVAGDDLSFSADTASYTVQSDLYDPQFDSNGNAVKGPAGPAEPTSCGKTRYGKTIWTAFHASKYGVARITAISTGFDPVIRVIPFENPSTNPAPDLPGTCYDDNSGVTQTASGLVTPGQWIAVQVGGTAGKKAGAGGPVQVKIALDPPPVVDGSAVLRWKSGRVSSLKVTGVTNGATVSLTCGKHACKSVKKTARTSKFSLLSNRKVKKGTAIVVRIAATGYIGKQFVWRAGGKMQLSCTNPGSTRGHKPGTCTG